MAYDTHHPMQRARWSPPPWAVLSVTLAGSCSPTPQAFQAPEDGLASARPSATPPPGSPGPRAPASARTSDSASPPSSLPQGCAPDPFGAAFAAIRAPRSPRTGAYPTHYPALSAAELLARAALFDTQTPGHSIHANLDARGFPNSIRIEDPCLVPDHGDHFSFDDQERERWRQFIAIHADVFGVDDPGHLSLSFERLRHGLVVEQRVDGVLIGHIQIHTGKYAPLGAQWVVYVDGHLRPGARLPPAQVSAAKAKAPIVGRACTLLWIEPPLYPCDPLPGEPCVRPPGPSPEPPEVSTIAEGDLRVEEHIMLVGEGSSTEVELRRVLRVAWNGTLVRGRKMIADSLPRTVDAITGELVPERSNADLGIVAR